MEISFVLDWASFFLGVGATFVLALGAMFTVAALQYRKAQRGGRRNRL